MGADLALMSAGAIPVQPGWTWTATMGLLQNIITLALGGGGLGLLIRAGVQLKRIANERAKQEDDRDSARWTELMGYNASLTGRVEKLESDLREERKRCDDEIVELRKQHLDEITSMRRDHAAEVRALNEKFDALQRMMIQNQLSTAQALTVPANAPRAAEKFERVGEHLRHAAGKDVE